MDIKEVNFSINGRTYNPPVKPVVVICIDGCGDEYLSTSIAYGRMPYVAEFAKTGYRGLVRGALPSFTNVNNSSIATGAPPSVTGIGGNFFLDPESGEEVMMNSAKYLRCETIFSAAADAGRKVAFITAKEKLRDILSKGMKGGIAFSSEKASEAKLETHGVENVEVIVNEKTPEIYSGDASIYVLKAGVALIKKGLADFLYLSLTDYMQHKYKPEDKESLDFYQAIDTEIGHLLDLGAIVGATADHGMNAKNDSEGNPNVIFLETVLKKHFDPNISVICPITDPYVVHHGALGSLVMVHLPEKCDENEIADWLIQQDGITEVYSRSLAAKKLELPEDRIGDLTVMCARDYVLGRTEKDHDLSLLKGGLRSHGGRYEEMVPMLLSRPLNDHYSSLAQGDPRNFDIFEFTCNGGNS
jgi:phosphonoacetate hydrolase